MMKALGLNAVATYVFWNYHETAPGVWDWTTGNRNIRAFLKAAADEGMMVILRPGPYACGEWEYGGYPWWLSTVPEMKIRTQNKAFLDSCRTYIGQLAAQVRDFQITKGGPIVMVQAENEFGSYVSQRKDIPSMYTDSIVPPSVSSSSTPASTSPCSPAMAAGSLRAEPSRALCPHATAKTISTPSRRR